MRSNRSHPLECLTSGTKVSKNVHTLLQGWTLSILEMCGLGQFSTSTSFFKFYYRMQRQHQTKLFFASPDWFAPNQQTDFLFFLLSFVTLLKFTQNLQLDGNIKLTLFYMHYTKRYTCTLLFLVHQKPQTWRQRYIFDTFLILLVVTMSDRTTPG